jgi:FtsZ-interacting cell division protein YlmF
MIGRKQQKFYQDKLSKSPYKIKETNNLSNGLDIYFKKDKNLSGSVIMEKRNGKDRMEIYFDTLKKYEDMFDKWYQDYHLKRTD